MFEDRKIPRQGFSYLFKSGKVKSDRWSLVPPSWGPGSFFITTRHGAGNFASHDRRKITMIINPRERTPPLGTASALGAFLDETREQKFRRFFPVKATKN